MRWHLWSDLHEDEQTRRQINTNLRSVTLARAGGYQITNLPGTRLWLQNWKQVIGAKQLRQLLAEQDAEETFADLLTD